MAPVDPLRANRTSVSGRPEEKRRSDTCSLSFFPDRDKPTTIYHNCRGNECFRRNKNSIGFTKNVKFKLKYCLNAHVYFLITAFLCDVLNYKN